MPNWKTVLLRLRASLTRRGRAIQEAEELVQQAWTRLVKQEQEAALDASGSLHSPPAADLPDLAQSGVVAHRKVVITANGVLLEGFRPPQTTEVRQRRTARLKMGLTRLEPLTRDIFVSNRVDGMSYQEIAERYGLTIPAVEKHVARATLQLVNWMDAGTSRN